MLSSILAFMAGIAAKIADPVAALKAELNDLRDERDDLIRSLEIVRSERNDFARSFLIIRKDRDDWRALAEGLYSAQAQAQAQNAYKFCNCVPARHDMFLRG